MRTGTKPNKEKQEINGNIHVTIYIYIYIYIYTVYAYEDNNLNGHIYSRNARENIFIKKRAFKYCVGQWGVKRPESD